MRALGEQGERSGESAGGELGERKPRLAAVEASAARRFRADVGELVCLPS